MLSLKEIVSVLSLKPTVDISEDIYVSGIGSLENAASDEISFIASAKYAGQLARTKACAVIMDYEGMKPFIPSDCKFIILDSKNPYLSFARATRLFHRESIDKESPEDYEGLYYADKTAVIGKNSVIFPGVFIGRNSKVGENCKLMSNVFIGKNVSIGNNVLIYPNASVYDRSIIGNNCIIHAGAVIGSDGFGFARDKGGFVKIIHSGIAELEDDVEIGANTTIDRGAVDRTVIGKGTKLDNLVQVAHNVLIGKNCVIAAQTGIAGSSMLKDNITIGGQVGIAGHISIGNNVMIAAQSGVSNNVEDNQVISGSPAFSIKDWRNSVVLFKRLPEIYKKLKEITKNKGVSDE